MVNRLKGLICIVAGLMLTGCFGPGSPVSDEDVKARLKSALPSYFSIATLTPESSYVGDQRAVIAYQFTLKIEKELHRVMEENEDFVVFKVLRDKADGTDLIMGVIRLNATYEGGAWQIDQQIRYDSPRLYQPGELALYKPADEWRNYVAKRTRFEYAAKDFRPGADFKAYLREKLNGTYRSVSSVRYPGTGRPLGFGRQGFHGWYQLNCFAGSETCRATLYDSLNRKIATSTASFYLSYSSDIPAKREWHIAHSTKGWSGKSPFDDLRFHLQLTEGGIMARSRDAFAMLEQKREEK